MPRPKGEESAVAAKRRSQTKNPDKKEPVVYPYTTGIAFLVTPKVSPLSGRDDCTIGEWARHSNRIARQAEASSRPRETH
jgi:hypothetical protein